MISFMSIAARPWKMMCICVTLICVVACILVNATWIYSIYFPFPCVTQTWPSSPKHKDSPSNANLSGEPPSFDIGDEQMKTSMAQFVQRHEWVALSPKYLVERQPKQLPVHYVIVDQTYTDNCSSLAEVSSRLRIMQQLHMESYGWDDIMYNFFIGGDGRIYVGKDWNDVDKGWNILFNNSRNIEVSFIGIYDKIPPTKARLNALRTLIESTIETGKLSPDYKLLASRRIKDDASLPENPEHALYETIKALPHWSLDD